MGTISCRITLVRSFNDLDNDDTEKLQKLRDNNQLLADLYPIADLLRNLWTEKNRCEALQQIRHMMGLCWAIARTHGFKPAHDFGDMLLRRLDGIINCGRYGYGSEPLEGSNNAIKVLKRTAYSFWISTTYASRFLPVYQGVATPEALCYTDASTDLWPSLKPVFSSVVFIQIQDESSPP